MHQNTTKPILIDFLAYSGTGKSTHAEALSDYLEAKDAKVKILRYSVRRGGKAGSFDTIKKQPIPTLLTTIRLGFSLWKISIRKLNIISIFSLIKWTQRSVAYRNHINSCASDNLDYIIFDPSLTTKLKNIHKHFDENSLADVISLLEKHELTSDIIVIIDAYMDVVLERRFKRGILKKVLGDSSIFPIRKAFKELEGRNSSMHFTTVNFNCFSEFDANIEQLTETCNRVKLQKTPTTSLNPS